jgi:hypothetical protein
MLLLDVSSHVIFFPFWGVLGRGSGGAGNRGVRGSGA